MSKLFILVSALLMIAGATVGVMQYMEVGPFAPKDEAAVAAKAPPPAPPVYVDVDPLMVSVFEGDRVKATLQIQVKLEVAASNEQAVQRLMPKLVNAYLRDFYGYIPRALSQSDRLDLVALKQRMIRLSNEAIGENMVQDVLVQSVMDTPR